MIPNSHSFIKKPALVTVFLLFACFAFSQYPDTTKRIFNFSGAASITNNGFSFIPAFTLGKPAAVVNLYVGGGKRFSFEPEFRYSLSGKPWSFIFIWRYKLVRKNKFQFTLGTHLPALSFISGPVIKNGVEQETIQARRFFPVIEMFPNHFINKNISVGMFYQYAFGIEKELARHTHFISLRSSFSNIGLPSQYYIRFNPQFFYLKMDDADGFYVASGLALSKRNFPISISSLVNKALQTDIPGKDFDWNISLIYSFNNSFTRL